MNKLLRRAAAAATLAFAAASAMAQDKAPAPVPANDSEVMYPIADGGIGGCLNDNHGGAIKMQLGISLTDIAKPGTTGTGPRAAFLLFPLFFFIARIPRRFAFL